MVYKQKRHPQLDYSLYYKYFPSNRSTLSTAENSNNQYAPIEMYCIRQYTLLMLLSEL